MKHYSGTAADAILDPAAEEAVRIIDIHLRDLTASVKSLQEADAALLVPPVLASYVTIDSEPSITNSRQLLATAPLVRTDNGAGSTVVLSINTATLGSLWVGGYGLGSIEGSDPTFIRTDATLEFPAALKTATDRTLTLSDEGADVKFVSSTGNIAGDVSWLGEHTFIRTNGNVAIDIEGSDAGRSPKIRFTPFAGAGLQNVQMFTGSTGAWALENESAYLPIIISCNAAAGLKHLSVRDGKVVIGDNTDVLRSLTFDRADADGDIDWDGGTFTFSAGIDVPVGDNTFLGHTALGSGGVVSPNIVVRCTESYGSSASAQAGLQFAVTAAPTGASTGGYFGFQGVVVTTGAGADYQNAANNNVVAGQAGMVMSHTGTIPAAAGFQSLMAATGVAECGLFAYYTATQPTILTTIPLTEGAVYHAPALAFTPSVLGNPFALQWGLKSELPNELTSYTEIVEITAAAAGTPAATKRRLYVDDVSGELSVRTSGGSTVSLEGGGGSGDSFLEWAM